MIVSQIQHIMPAPANIFGHEGRGGVGGMPGRDAKLACSEVICGENQVASKSLKMWMHVPNIGSGTVSQVLARQKCNCSPPCVKNVPLTASVGSTG